MEAISLAAQTIAAGDNHIVIAGGMENMSLVPHYFHARNATKLGDVKMIDGLVKDGLTDVYNQVHMGVCAEKCAKEKNISREEQDKFTVESYKRSAAAWAAGKFKNEIIPVTVPQRKGDPIVVSEDEEYKNVKLDKIPTLSPVFDKTGTQRDHLRTRKLRAATPPLACDFQLRAQVKQGDRHVGPGGQQ